MNYFVWLDNASHGPFDAFQLSSMASTGMVGPESLVQLEGGKWRAFSEVFPNQLPEKLPAPTDPDKNRFVLTDVEMPFWRMAENIFRWTFASIPTAVVLFIVLGLLLPILARWR